MTTLDTGMKLAVERTRLAHERTTMAWGRTAASLISFGFTIYKFFDIEQEGTGTGIGSSGHGDLP
jgi:inner membrane protein YidH